MTLKVNLSVTILLCQVVDSFIKLLFHVTLTGGLGHNSALGNTTSINVKGKNIKKGCIGAENSYKIEGDLFHVLLG